MIDKFMYGFLNRAYGYDDYTQLEINSKLIQKMDEVIENCNNAFEYVDWLKEQGVPEEVQNILFTWKEDSTIKDIVDEQIFTELRSSISNNYTAINTLKEELRASNEALKNELIDKVCYVSNVDELKEALKTNKHIKLLEGVYRLTSSLELEEYTTLEGLGKVVVQGSGIDN